MGIFFISLVLIVLASVVFFVGGFFLGRYFLERIGTTKILEAEERAVQIVQEAQKEANEYKELKVSEVNQEWKKKRREFDQEVVIKNNKFNQMQKQVLQKEGQLKKQSQDLRDMERKLQDQRKEIEQTMETVNLRSSELERITLEQNQRLESISNLQADEARQMLVDNMLAKAREEATETIHQIHEEAEQQAERLAEKTLLTAIQRISFEQATENALSVVHIQSDELKGRIIGREGRNIKAFENATGVDIIVDDTPEVVILSCFDPLRRELAKLTLQKLLVDGIIHPVAIEKAYEDAKKEIDDVIMSAGEETISSLQIPDMPAEVVGLIGKMKYHTVYGQNLLQHSREVAMLAGLMASELKLDARVAKRAALLHDIGLVLPESDEPHAIAGRNFLKKFNESAVVLNAVAAHHGDVVKESPIAELVDAANVISLSRPGARGAVTADGNVKRLESLEEIAKGFPGVLKTYALQAGREIRVIVEGDNVSDSQADVLAHDIARKIESEVQYPGQIKVSIIRERRSIAYAK
ncbi:ribonuclease Y [Chlorobium phaeobacteroides]|jgi:ribonuclease Y|uniref:Ribonuclease Y n=1 Tax=Chlorobium phaeobacteroides (strain DSM 266 / SMG 266 / 2430) TaxID=290317 RepID=RNY_CHLPD|nr:ribonuclease Y [Chlorobium phaeobacteroides]A1BEZ9.1 RecName: Full=Ribonuclease Y; Short=RNase Y [Chlorobium phaeobacteroides DSM 266]ABL64976.1 metal dependent phosphohydrolase [Chlorobium phaeobacteroides DSM 266]MBV5329663.1 ribonuclease Y [Chlorobium sp.]